MTTFSRISTIAIAVSAGWALPSAAQAQDAASIQQELAAMRAQMSAMASRIDTLEAQLAGARAEAKAANEAAAVAVATSKAAPAPAAAKPPVEIAWKGAPEFKGEGGWSFKPRGRIQVDAGTVSAPEGISDKGLGFANEVRRARLGFEGHMPGGFGYRLEADFAGSQVEVYDAYVTYGHGPLTVTVGQHNNFQGLDELSSSLNTSFMERSAFTDAFGFERRVGVSGVYDAGAVIVQAGAFTDNLVDLGSDENNAFGFDGRIVYMPRLGDTQLHIGGSVHYRDLGNSLSTVRYRQRPFLHTTDTRFIDTGNVSAKSETGYGLEAALIRGRFHVATEGYWQKVARPGGADPTFFGGSAELGYFLTKGDSRGYKGGNFDRIKPAKGLNKGGIGAIQVNLRYDYLDLVDAGIVGGMQNGYSASLVWTPVTHLRLMAEYGLLEYDQARTATVSGVRSYSVDTFAMRAQIDF